MGVKIANDEDKLQNAEKSILSAGVALFHYFRTEAQLLKQPSTAELLNWMQLLANRGLQSAKLNNDQTKAIFISSATVTLFKQKDDQDQASHLITAWLNRPAPV